MQSLFGKLASSCCGCGACVARCPQQAITMHTDEEGFWYPSIDKAKCISCGLCTQVCDFQKKKEVPQEEYTQVYAVKHKADDVRMASSSGGAFTALSDVVLQKGGSVFGAAFKQDGRVVHCRATTAAERDPLRGSKYLPSNAYESYPAVKADLQHGRKVLFTGTPCQVAGLLSYLGGKDKNLYTCDFVCHGTPSPTVFMDYLRYLQRRYRAVPVDFTFRDKEYGWRQVIRCGFSNGKKYIGYGDTDFYYRLFFGGYLHRPSCFNCKYTTVQRQSDITLSDFWNIDKACPDFKDEKGVSTVFLHSEQGKALFDLAKPALLCRSCQVEDCMQPQLRTPPEEPKDRAAFWTDYAEKGFAHAANKYANISIQTKLKHNIKIVLKKTGLLSYIKRR